VVALWLSSWKLTKETWRKIIIKFMATLTPLITAGRACRNIPLVDLTGNQPGWQDRMILPCEGVPWRVKATEAR
jgi:hypothetical protein